MNKNTYKQILDRIAKYAKGKMPNGQFDLSQLGKYANATKALTATTVVGELPGVKDLVTKVNDAALGLEEKLFNVTLGKIPGVGKILRNLNEGLNEFNKNVLEGLNLRKERVNHPRFWSRLGTHSEFNIPSGYTNQADALHGPIRNVPSTATIGIVDNPVPSFEATKMQLTQLRSLLKAVRGLSNLPYTIGDLLTYSINVDALLKLYYKTMKAVVYATKHTLSKPNVPKSIITGLGINYTDLINNLADYEKFLTVMYGYLNKNLALPNFKWERIKALSMCLLGDNTKLNNSTIYQFSYSMIYSTQSKSSELEGSSFEGILWSLSDIQTKFNTIINYFEGEQMSNITADIIGAFGTTAVFNDAPTKNVELKISNDPLLLNAIKNGDIQHYKLSAYSAQNSYIFDTLSNIKVIASDYDRWTPATIETKTVNTSFQIVSSQAIQNKFSDETMKLLLPRIASCKEFGFIDLTKNATKELTVNDYKAVSVEKDKMKEAEALETMQFSSVLRAVYLSVDSTNTPQIIYNVDTCYTMIVRIKVDSYNGYAFVDTDLCNFSDFSNETVLDETQRIATLWALVDWLPRLDYVKYRGTNPADRNLPVTLWDLAATGLLSMEGRKLATYYQTYSQLALVFEPTTDKYNAKTYRRD